MPKKNPFKRVKTPIKERLRGVITASTKNISPKPGILLSYLIPTTIRRVKVLINVRGSDVKDPVVISFMADNISRLAEEMPEGMNNV